MKKLILSLAIVMAAMITMAESQFYVIMKDGTGTSFPESAVDSLTFNDNNGAKISGFDEFLKSISQLKEQIESLIGKNEELSNSVSQLRKDLDSQNNVNANQSDSIAQLRSDIDSLKKLIASKPQNNATFEGHGYVDLGLPSGNLWATTNIGADAPEDYGLYFVWGGTEGKNVGIENPLDGMSPFFLFSQGYIDGNNNLISKYDAASVYWGENWILPTKTDAEELLQNCNHVWTELNGKNGILFTGTNGNTLFIPVAGMMKETDAQVGVRGYYMLATAANDDINCNYIYLSQDNVSCGISRRMHARTVRPILKRNTFINTKHDYIDLGLPSGLLWATHNLGAATPEELGELYLWSETQPYSNSNATMNNKVYFSTVVDMIADSIIDKKGILTPKHDAVATQWKDGWRMPTKEDINELIENCTFYESRMNNNYGITVSGPNGNRIFIPSYLRDPSETIHDVCYWTSERYTGIEVMYPPNKYSFAFRFITYDKIGEELNMEHVNVQLNEHNSNFPIRPVKEPQKTK